MFCSGCLRRSDGVFRALARMWSDAKGDGVCEIGGVSTSWRSEASSSSANDVAPASTWARNESLPNAGVNSSPARHQISRRSRSLDIRHHRNSGFRRPLQRVLQVRRRQRRQIGGQRADTTSGVPCTRRGPLRAAKQGSGPRRVRRRPPRRRDRAPRPRRSRSSVTTTTSTTDGVRSAAATVSAANASASAERCAGSVLSRDLARCSSFTGITRHHPVSGVGCPSVLTHPILSARRELASGRFPGED